jgi:hypothetical protein
MRFSMSGPDYPREPLLHSVAIGVLRPTQVTVGMGEVKEKRLRRRGAKDKTEFLAWHLVPALLGPNGHRYVLDHHHLARALADFLGRRMERQLVESDFEAPVAEALLLVRSHDAAYLAGWCGAAAEPD